MTACKQVLRHVTSTKIASTADAGSDIDAFLSVSGNVSPDNRKAVLGEASSTAVSLYCDCR